MVLLGSSNISSLTK